MYYCVRAGDNHAVSQGFTACGGLLNNEDPKMGLVVPQLSNLENMISDAIGEDVVKHLAKHKSIKLPQVEITLFTNRQPPLHVWYPLLLAFTPKVQMEKVINANPKSPIVLIPWTKDEMDFFVEKFSAKVV